MTLHSPPYTRARRVLGALALILVSACRADPPVGSDLDPGAVNVIRHLESYYREFSNRDWRRFSAHFWPGAGLTTAWQPPGEDSVRVVTMAIEQFVEQAPFGPGSREIFEERMLDSEVKVDGNIAQALVRYRARFGDPGDIMEWEGTDAFTLLRFNGEWRITSLAYLGDS